MLGGWENTDEMEGSGGAMGVWGERRIFHYNNKKQINTQDIVQKVKKVPLDILCGNFQMGIRAGQKMRILSVAIGVGICLQSWCCCNRMPETD